MATRQKLKEEFLTCIICHEVFRDPVTLHCGHTFCTQCVTTYTKTQKQAIGDKSIPCPHCRGLTKVPEPKRPVDEWAGQMKTGFFVKGLVETVVRDKNGDPDDLCTSCQEGGEAVPAVVWCCDCGHGLCSGCEKFHRRLPLLKGHELINLSDSNKNTVQKSRKRFSCPKHPDAVIDMMCEDCDVAICHRCCILHHRKCDSVITLEESLPKLKSVIEEHEKELFNVVKMIDEDMFVKKRHVKNVEKEAEEAITNIDVSREKIIAEVMKQEKDLKEKVKYAKEDALQKLKGFMKIGDMRREEAVQRQGLIKKAMESDIPMNYYEMYKICKPSVVSNATDATSNVQVNNYTHMKLESKGNQIVSFVRETLLAAFSLSMIDSNMHVNTPPPVGSQSKPRLLKKIETGIGGIIDVLIMSLNGTKAILVVSCERNCILSFYQEQGKLCMSELRLAGSAYNLARISAGKCATAVLSSKQIHFVLVAPHLKLEKTMQTGKGYLGLACLNPSTLAASTDHPGFVDIIDMSGTVLRSFGSDLFTGPTYLTCMSTNLLLVSDYSRKSVTGMTDTGVVKFKYPQKTNTTLQFPRGVGHTRHGEVFAADEKSNTVVQLTDTGKFVREILSFTDGLREPRALFVDDDNLMYVSVNHRTIHVYEFK